jgi:xanthine dehydrogenase accessory factor
VREELLRALTEVLTSGRRGALATVVRTGGSTPQRPGARMLMRPDRSVMGTVGGGAVEQLVCEALAACIERGEPSLFVRELGHDLGMCCGGRMEVFIEPVEAPPRLWLCGAGHVGAATAPLAASIGFEVTVVDEREELNTAARFPGLARMLIDPTSWLKRTALDGRDWLLIATHEHALDEQILELALAQAPRYIGLMGSRRKVYRLLERITLRRGPLAFERVYGPVGLTLGAVGPAEIAVSIVAELVALRRGEVAAHMRAIDDPRLRELLAAAGAHAAEAP